MNNNDLTDNTDVQMVVGNGTSTQITNNTFQSWLQTALAAFALDNFGQAALGNFAGTVAQGNTVNCGGKCNIA